MALTESFLDDKAMQLVAVMAESLLVGAFAILIIVMCWILVTKSRVMPRTHKILFGASISMFVLSAVHVGLVIEELSAKHVPRANAQTQIILSMFQYCTGDLVLIWRVWVIWERRYWVAAGPLFLMLAAAGLTLHLLSAHGLFFTVAPVALIVANTSLCTSLIAGRIWYLSYSFSNSHSASRCTGYWRRAVALVIESGMLYTLVQILSLILNYTENVALPVLLDLEIPLIGILPTLIIVLAYHELPARRDSPSAPHDRPTTLVASDRIVLESGTGSLSLDHKRSPPQTIRDILPQV